MRDESKIDELVKTAVEADLKGLDFLAQFSYAQLAEGYNGIGPEFLPPAVRERVSEILEIFEPAALIHDMRYFVGDGCRRCFYYANWEFQENCRKLANRAYPWYSWKRYRARAVADMLANAVSSEAGWIAWQEASEKHAAKEAK